MTTVVGLAGLHGVWMAADTMTNVYDRPVGGAVKILRLPLSDKRSVLIGVAGNAGMPGLVRRSWKPEFSLPDSAAGLQEWCDEIASWLTEPMLAAAMTVDGQLDGNLLFGVPGRPTMMSSLWTIGHHMAIRHEDGRGAIGSGEGPAMGALDALLSVGTEPREAVRQACEIAVSRDRWSGLPIQHESLPIR